MLGVLAAFTLPTFLPPPLNFIVTAAVIWSVAFVGAGVQHARWMVLIWAAAFAALNWVAYSTIRHLVRL